MWCTFRLRLELDVYVDLLPQADVDVRLKNLNCVLHVYLRVKGEDTLVVATHQEDGRQVLRQRLQPGHVQGAGHRALPGQWQTHDNEVGCA